MHQNSLIFHPTNVTPADCSLGYSFFLLLRVKTNTQHQNVWEAYATLKKFTLIRKKKYCNNTFRNLNRQIRIIDFLKLYLWDIFYKNNKDWKVLFLNRLNGFSLALESYENPNNLNNLFDLPAADQAKVLGKFLKECLVF